MKLNEEHKQDGRYDLENTQTGLLLDGQPFVQTIFPYQCLGNTRLLKLKTDS